MRITIIFNPIAGRGRLGSVVEDIVARLRASGCEVAVLRTAAAGDATSFANAVADGTRAVLAVGGDGTVREVVGGLAGRSIPVVILPAGTENLVARECGMTADPESIVDTILHGRRQRFDLGVINGCHFGIVVGIGFDGEVVARLAARRRGNITHLSYFAPIWRTFWGHRFPPIRVEIDGELVFDGRGMVFVGVMPCYSVGLRVVRDAVWDDGLLDLCILPCVSRVGLLRHAFRVWRRVHVEHNGVIYKRCNRLRVSSTARVAVEVDGDTSGHLPVDIGIEPAAGMILMPR